MGKTKKPRKPRDISDRSQPKTWIWVDRTGLWSGGARFKANTPSERARLADWLRRAADWLEAQE